MDQDRREWLEDQGSDQLEREAAGWDRGGFSVRIPDGRELIFQSVDDAVIAAHTILSEAEIKMGRAE